MAHASRKSIRRKAKSGRDAFKYDDAIEGEYENPGPRMNPDAEQIAAIASKVLKMQVPARYVIRWAPKWLKRANAKAHEAAVKTLDKARKELAKAKTEDERAQGNMRASMAQDTARLTQMALNSSPDAEAFSLYFFEQKLAVDLFDRDVEELDAMQLGMTPLQQIASSLKTKLCGDRGIRYFALGPDDEIDDVQMAAKLGVVTAKKGAQRTRVPGNGDGIIEEEVA